MRFQIAIGVLVFGFTASARPVEVILDASKTLIQDHTVTVSLGVRLKSGRIIGQGLFDRKDLAAGVTARTLEIDEPIANCEFSWMIANQIPGEPRVTRPDLMQSHSFDGVWKDKCEVNSDDQIQISLPFTLHEIETHVNDLAFTNRKAKQVLASIAPSSSDVGESFSSWTTQANKSSTPASRQSTKRLLAKGTLEFQVETYWTLEAGGLTTDRKTLKGPTLEID